MSEELPSLGALLRLIEEARVMAEKLDLRETVQRLHRAMPRAARERALQVGNLRRLKLN